jgi:SLT domain-containing protein
MLTDAEYELILRESSGNPLAKNPRSTSFGLGQLIKGNRIKYAAQIGVDPNTTDPVDQIALARAYISTRYGTAEKALAYWDKAGYY